MKASCNAYAKINLFLDIESRRSDGYHNILSHMQSITLHDVVNVEYIPADDKSIVVSCDDSDIPCDKRNLAYKAADIFPIKSGTIKIHIQKNIPMSAGLAGGSTDAAATLLALNSMFDEMLSLDELKALGNNFGADVPFCIEKGACITRGTGEIIQKTTCLPAFPILIAKHGEGMSTPQAYAELDKKYNNFVNYTTNVDCFNKLLEDCELPSVEPSFAVFNIFESVVEPKRPFVTFIKNVMNKNCAVASMMSGSGTSVFGIFKSEADAQKAKSQLASQNIKSSICYLYNNEK